MKKTIILAILLFNTIVASAQCYKNVANGYYHTIAVKLDGTLWAWGKNNYGQLGDNTLLDKSTPVQVGTSNTWSSVACGEYQSFGIKTDGTLWAWGLNSSGQIGNGTTIDCSAPIQVGTATNWISVAGGYLHSIAVRADGTLWAWGSGADGALGDNSITDKTLPIQVDTATNWLSVSCGGRFSHAIKTTGTLWGWGQSSIVGTSTNTNHPIQIGTSTDWAKVSARGTHSLAIKSNGTLWSAGLNTYGELGDGSLGAHSTFAQVGTATDWASVSAGGRYSLGLKTTGTFWAWGENTYGAYGDNTTTTSYVPLQIGTAANWVSVSSGLYHSSSISTSNELWRSGYNTQGQLGDGTLSDKILLFPIVCSDGLPCYDASTSSLTTGLLAYYPFGGGSLHDYSGHGNDLSNSTTAHPTTDRNGNSSCAYSFTKANNEYLELLTPTFLNNVTTAPFSISLWYQPVGTRPLGNYELLIGRDTGLHCPDTYGQWSLGLYDCRKAVMGFDMNSHWQTSPILACDSLLGNISSHWHHVAFVFDGTNYKLYVDGVLDMNTHGPCGAMSANMGSLLLGKDFTGDLDDILMYNRALSAAEVIQLNGLGSSCCSDKPLGIGNIPTDPSKTIKVYPNPASSFLNIALKEPIISTTILDISGRLLREEHNPGTQIDISSLHSGLYFIKIETKQGTYRQKFVKQ